MFVFLALFLGIPTLMFLIGEFIMARQGLSGISPNRANSGRFDIL